MTTTLLSASSQERSAQVFNIASVIAVLLLPVFPILMLWIAGSIFVYASIAHHPNQRVREYLRFSGYRFYGLVGSLVVVLNYTNELRRLFGGTMPMWGAIWLISILVVVPLGLRDIRRAARERWVDMAIDT
jgi:hypothetical protein